MMITIEPKDGCIDVRDLTLEQLNAVATKMMEPSKRLKFIETHDGSLFVKSLDLVLYFEMWCMPHRYAINESGYLIAVSLTNTRLAQDWSICHEHGEKAESRVRLVIAANVIEAGGVFEVDV